VRSIGRAIAARLSRRREDPPEERVPERRPEPDVEGAEAVAQAWERVERWLAEHHPRGTSVLAAGASDEALAAAEERIGRAFPPALRASLRRHAGQPEDAPEIVEGHTLLGPEEIATDWATLVEIKADVGTGDDWWRPAWIPFSSDGMGQAFCVDADTGAVVEFVHDGEHDPVARRLEGWLARWAEELEAGEQVLDPGRGGIDAAWLVHGRGD
jgi:cell wall assembly regulator SMI1